MTHVIKDSVMKELLTRSCRDWNVPKTWINNENLIPLVEKNKNDLEALGLWGVPSFKYGDTIVWGQDRLWALEEAILSSDT